MTLSDLANNVHAKTELKTLLDNPVMVAVLDMLRDANLPKLVLKIPDAPPSMDPMQAFALSAAQRAGFQSCLSLLRNLPAMTNPAAVSPLGTPWEYLAQPQSAPVDSPSKGRKRSQTAS